MARFLSRVTDPVWHSFYGGNSAGAANISTTSIQYARNGDTAKFLFIESKAFPVPSGNDHEAPFLNSELGYALSDYDVMEGADLTGRPNH